MGWASGTELIVDVWATVRDFIPAKKRVDVLNELINIFTDKDWDCVDELADEQQWPEVKEAVNQYLKESE